MDAYLDLGGLALRMKPGINPESFQIICAQIVNQNAACVIGVTLVAGCKEQQRLPIHDGN